MAEAANLLALVGAVDGGIVAGVVDRELVARFYAPYESPRTVGWFGDFERWAIEHAPGADGSAIPAPGEALVAMAEGGRPRPRDGARRIVALAVLGRFFQNLDLAGVDEEAIVRALAPVTAHGDESEAKDLLDILVSDAFTSIHAWDGLITEIEPMLHQAMAAQPEPSCGGRVVPVDVGGDRDPAACLETQHVVSLPLSALVGYLNPANWASCSDHWCEMEPRPPTDTGLPVFRERVAIDCSTGPVVSACLFFASRSWADPDRCTLEYWLHDPNPKKVDSDVVPVVDEGWIRCEAVDDTTTRVETMKLILFEPPFDMAWMGFLSCVGGWADSGLEHMLNCATDPPTDEGTGPVPFETHTTRPTEEVAAMSANELQKAIQEAFDTASACLQESAAMWTDSLSTAEASGADDSAVTAEWFSQRAVDGTTLGLKHTAALWGAGLKVAQAAATVAKVDGTGPDGPVKPMGKKVAGKKQPVVKKGPAKKRPVAKKKGGGG